MGRSRYTKHEYFLFRPYRNYNLIKGIQHTIHVYVVFIQLLSLGITSSASNYSFNIELICLKAVCNMVSLIINIRFTLETYVHVKIAASQNF